MFTNNASANAILDGPVIVVLGGGLKANGSPTEATRLRAEAAVDLAGKVVNSTIIFAGDGRTDNNRHRAPEAIVMMRIFMSAFERFVEESNELVDDSSEGLYSRLGGAFWKNRLYSRISLETQSADTVGNAVLVAARYLQGQSPQCAEYPFDVIVVTSPFHEERAGLAFRSVLGDSWNVMTHSAVSTADNEQSAAKETGGIEWMQSFFAGIEGDVSAAVTRLREYGKPVYHQLAWLSTCEPQVA